LEVSFLFPIFAPNINKKRMTKRLLSIAFAAFLTLSVPVSLMAVSSEPTIEQSGEREVTIAVQQSSIIVNNAQGQTLEVVSLTGKQIIKVKIESPSQRVELDVPKGCYIVKVGKVVRKIAIR
jgi:hypothetical protein